MIEPKFTLEEMIAEVQEQLEKIGVGDRWTCGEITAALGLHPMPNNVSMVGKKVRNLVGLGKASYAGKKLAKVLGGPMQGGYMRANYCYTLSQEALEELVRYYCPKERQ